MVVVELEGLLNLYFGLLGIFSYSEKKVLKLRVPIYETTVCDPKTRTLGVLCLLPNGKFKLLYGYLSHPQSHVFFSEAHLRGRFYRGSLRRKDLWPSSETNNLKLNPKIGII